MTARKPRNFTLADAIVLVAATAAGLATCRAFADLRGDRWASLTGSHHENLNQIIFMLRWVTPYPTDLLFWWTAAIFALFCCVKRPRRRILWSRPGFLACVAVLLLFAWNGLRFAFA